MNQTQNRGRVALMPLHNFRVYVAKRRSYTAATNRLKDALKNLPEASASLSAVFDWLRTEPAGRTMDEQVREAWTQYRDLCRSRAAALSPGDGPR